MLMLDIAVVSTALPHIAQDLHSGLSGVQRVIDAYTLNAGSSRAQRRGRSPTGSAGG
jgi:hypothetical protein